MKWFKHKSGSHEHPDISDAWDEFGDSAVVVFWTTLEVYADRYADIDDDGYLILSISFWERNLRRKFKKFVKIFEFFEKRQRFLLKISEKSISIKIPKFIEIASNWTTRTNTLPTEVHTEVHTEAPTAIEEEEEVEEEVEVKNKKPFGLPSKESIQESSRPKIENDIEAICQKLYEDKIFPEVHAFKNMMLKKNKNERAILHVLSRCYLARPDAPWAYCQKIIATEDGNFNERDFRKTTPKSNG